MLWISCDMGDRAIYAESATRDMSTRRRYTRNEKIFYVLSLLIVFSMVLSLIYVAIMPG